MAKLKRIIRSELNPNKPSDFGIFKSDARTTLKGLSSGRPTDEQLEEFFAWVQSKGGLLSNDEDKIKQSFRAFLDEKEKSDVPKDEEPTEDPVLGDDDDDLFTDPDLGDMSWIDEDSLDDEPDEKDEEDKSMDKKFTIDELHAMGIYLRDPDHKISEVTKDELLELMKNDMVTLDITSFSAISDPALLAEFQAQYEALVLDVLKDKDPDMVKEFLKENKEPSFIKNIILDKFEQFEEDKTAPIDPPEPPDTPDPADSTDPDKDDKEVEMEQKDGEFPEEFYENVLRELGLIKLDGISVSKKDGYKPKKDETKKSVKIVKEPDKKNTRVECNDVTCALGLFEKMLKDIQENGEKSEFYKKRILFNGQHIPMAEFASRGEDGLKDLREMVTYIEKNPGKDYEVPERKDDGKPVDEKNATKKTDQVLDELKGLDSKTRDVVKRVKGKEVKDVSEKVLKELESKEGKEKFKENYQELVRFEALRNRLERIAREVKELEKHPELLGTLLASKKQELIEALNEFNKEFSREKLEELYKFKAQLIFVGRAEPAKYRSLVPELGITDAEAKDYQEFSEASKDFIDGVRLGAQIRNFGHAAGELIPGETGDRFKELRDKNRETMKDARKVIRRANNPATHVSGIESKIDANGLLATVARGRIENFNNTHIRSRRVVRGKTLVVAPKYDAEMVTAALKLEQELDREIAGAKDPRKGLDI